MRRYPILAAIMVGSAALAGCSSGSDGAPSTTSTPSAASTPTSTLETHTAAPGAVGRSPGGVTTAVGAPAESTEEEYFQACHAATMWMTAQGGDPKTQFEPYLSSLQSSDQAGPGTFGTAWSQLPPGRQAAVIVAAEAAANDLCG
ncbi:MULTISPECIES: lipoprotein LpqV [unclassified Mycobacterium]|uniref:lipoprotein LpqV n=1 Tax=unclassified Mycobacterium TaxID=2642494 RepID=UPI0029C829DF|nr:MULTISPECIES: lipoprotein LpqV [unclassified Mycobacterium]